MGRSAQKRDAKRQAQAQYYAQLKKAERIDPLKSIDTQGSRKIADDMGDDMSYRSKRLAMQADKLGRQINQGSDDLNKNIDAYNDRFDELQSQMNGGSIKRFTTKINNPQGIAQATAGNGGLFTTAEGAGAAAAQQQDRLDSSSRNAITGQVVPQVNAITGQSTGPKVVVQETELGPINPSYRTLSQSTQAYNELSGLSKNVQNDPLNKYGTQYQAIGEKLKQSLQRDQRMAMPKQQTGLLGSEVISGNSSPIDAETIG